MILADAQINRPANFVVSYVWLQGSEVVNGLRVRE
jgi:hypothetical protein